MKCIFRYLNKVTMPFYAVHKGKTVGVFETWLNNYMNIYIYSVCIHLHYYNVNKMNEIMNIFLNI